MTAILLLRQYKPQYKPVQLFLAVVFQLHYDELQRKNEEIAKLALVVDGLSLKR